MTKLEQSVANLLTAAGLEPVAPLIVGVSGGPDSLALLHVLRRQLDPARLVAAHVHHGLRPAAGAEAAFVAATAAQWAVTYRETRLDLPTLARDRGWSLEEAGRHARYDFFAALARELGAPAVFVGHHAGDQVETLLLHLLRGTGINGLRGMTAVTPLPGAPGVHLLRPFLAVSRADIEAYCAAHQLEPVADETNQDLTYARNRVRGELLPLLETYNPNIRANLLSLAETADADLSFLETWTEQSWLQVMLDAGEGWVHLDAARWQELPLSLRRRTLRWAVEHVHPGQTDVGFRALEQARAVAESGSTGAESLLPGGAVIRVAYGTLEFTAADRQYLPNQPQLPSPEPLPLPVPGELALSGNWTLSATPLPTWDLAQIRANADPWRAFVAVTPDKLMVRPREPGERFQPLGMSGRSASVQDVMVNIQLDARLRDRWPLVATDAHSIWLPGYTIDHRVRVTPDSPHVVALHCTQTPNVL